ncbi:MAG: amino acid aminotransferase [Lautropia sp.]
MSSSLFAEIPLAAKDPILGVTEQFAADPRPGKANLGVGVYNDEHGKLPLLESVVKAEAVLNAEHAARGYLPIDGMQAYNKAVQTLLFGADSPLLASGRVITTQALGGTGALKLGADLVHWFAPGRKVLISNPSWENHRALFEAAGLAVHQYPYYHAPTRGLDFDGMLGALEAAEPGSVIVLHACCHNPTGVDLTDPQWDRVIEVLERKQHLPFLDIAYQGFAEGIEQDASAVRKFAAGKLPFLVSSSFSKSFSLYGERVGALSVVLADKDEAQRVLSQLKRVIRTNYSNPPTHGGAIVTRILSDPALRAQWEGELGAMRERIRAMRAGLVERLKAAGAKIDADYIVRQRGMFSYTGLTPAQVDRLRTDHAIYAVASGRICIAALNPGNLDRVAKAIAAVLDQG